MRGLDADDVRSAGIDVLMVNSFHLMLRPGIRTIQRLGGLHRFMGWDGPICTDSGGFQALSLIRQNPKNGSLHKTGLIFRHPHTGKKVKLTPEKTVTDQLALGTDVVICLDDCPDPADSYDDQARSVDRTIAWARTCRETFDRVLDGRRDDGAVRPKLVGVVQGGDHHDLRRRCAEALVDIGFDAYGFGGWPIDDDGVLRYELFELVHGLVPAGVPRFALGVGKPEHLARITALGGDWVFDCSLPTRDARHRRVFVFAEGFGGDDTLVPGSPFYRPLYLQDDKHGGDDGPLDASCDCRACTRYSRAYLHHLFKVKDTAAERLATIHNLRFYARLVARLPRGAA